MTTATADAATDTRAGVTVQLLDLHRHYGPVRALDGLTLEMAPGELVALLGPSGCGKTTALRALAGLDEADSGRILVDGREITHVPANKRDMGMVFQAYSLFPNMTARENVAYGLRLRGVDEATRRTRADEMLELVGLHAPGRPLPVPALGRPAAARRARPGARHPSRRCSCSTSRCRRSTRRSAASCATRSGASRSRSARRRCS